MNNKPSYGDLVDVYADGSRTERIGQGVVNVPPIANGVRDAYGIDTTYGPGWSATGENWLEAEPSQVALVESCWWQKWRRRVRGS